MSGACSGATRRRPASRLRLVAGADPSENGHFQWPLTFPARLAQRRAGAADGQAMHLPAPHSSFPTNAMDFTQQLAALTTSELQTAGANQATAIAVSVLLRHLRSPALSSLLTSAFENHHAVMLQTPWPDPMLQSFAATRRFLEGAAKPADDDAAPPAMD
jgi:hypothetical protein